MLAGGWDDVAKSGRMTQILTPLATLTKADIAFANLEATAPGNGEHIVKQPRLIGESRTLQAALDALPLDVVSLANNHTFDALWDGFAEVRELLQERSIVHLGAGEDLASAATPQIIERRGLRFVFLAFTALDSRPSHVASQTHYGVNPLDPAICVQQIAHWRQRADQVIVSLHWGVEYCHLPSPEQIGLGRRLIDAGASLVVGHHAHVVQGVEVHGDGVIAYNLGNAVTTDLDIDGRRAIRQSARTRSSFALRARFVGQGAESRLESVELVPFLAARGAIRVGEAGAGSILQRANRRLAAGVTPDVWKRQRLYEDVVVRTLRKLHPSVIGSVRPAHALKFFKNAARAIRGRGPTA